MFNSFLLDAMIDHHNACKDMARFGLIDINCPSAKGEAIMLSESAFKETFKHYKTEDLGDYDRLTAKYKGVEFVCMAKF